MLQIIDPSGILYGIGASYRGAPIGRAVIHQPEFPVLIALGQDALDCFLYEPLAVEEYSNS
jgi:hypothetical protein